MISRHYSLTNGFLIVWVLIAMMAIVPQVSADSSQTLIVPNSGKYPLPALQVNNSMEPVILNQELSTVNQTGVYLVPTGSIILQSDDGINRVFEADGTQFLAVYDTGVHRTHAVPNGAFVDSEGNITYIVSGNLLVMTIIDATERGLATPTPPPVVASFSPMPPNEGNPPLKVDFSDYSQGTITGWDWSFGDGADSSEQYPVHTYRANGTYNVTLTVRGPSGSDTFTYPGCITVGPRPPLAQFGVDPQRADYAPLFVTFTDYSLGDITGWLWNFGDGSTSAEQNPVHTYQKQGNYSVSLMVSGPAGTNTVKDWAFILVGPFPPVAHFEAIYTPHLAPCTVEFLQYSEGTITQWLWDFGDGTKSPDKKPTHTYQRDGNFTVNLTVTGPEGTSTKSRPSFIHVGEPFFIRADPIGIHSVGETFTITGKTNLPEGEELDYYVFTSAFNPGGPRFGNPSNATGTTQVVSGNSVNNSWSVILDTKEFRPDEYFVSLDSTTFNDVTGNLVFTLIKGKQTTADNPSSALVTPTIQSSIAVNGTVAPTTQPAPVPAALVILAIVCIGIIAARQRRKGR
jgi:PKD repeat protein